MDNLLEFQCVNSLFSKSSEGIAEKIYNQMGYNYFLPVTTQARMFVTQIDSCAIHNVKRCVATETKDFGPL